MNIFKRRQTVAEISTDAVKLLPFHETYTTAAMSLTVALLYPNPENERTRFKLIFLLLLFILPTFLALVYDIFICLMASDLNTVTRHFTVGVPSMVVWTKIVLLTWKRDKTKYIIEVFNKDQARYNSMSEDFKKIALEGIQTGKRFIELWFILMLFVGLMFPMVAVAKMFYSVLFDEIPKKYMVHDLRNPLSKDDEDKFKSPYFELLFINMTFVSIYYFFNFVGVDGLFGLAINHTCVKMNVYCKRLEKAFRQDDIAFTKSEIREVIKEQSHIFKYVETIQELFNSWLGFIFVGTRVQICTCIYRLMESKTSGDTFLCLTIGFASIVHIFLPCHNASKLKYESAHTAIRMYLCDWQRVSDSGVRRSLAIMIARAQHPLEITAFNMFSFDMEMFVTLLRTSYSLFTLIRP